MLNRRIALNALCALALAPIACKKTSVVEGYRVTGYNAATKQWTIIRNGTFTGNRYLTKRLIVVCSSYKSDKHEMVEGPDACQLQVGKMIVPNPAPGPGRDSELVDVDEMASETLMITEGAGEDRTIQLFDILKYEVLTDDPAK